MLVNAKNSLLLIDILLLLKLFRFASQYKMLNPFTFTHLIFRSSDLKINSFRICLELKQQPIQGLSTIYIIYKITSSSHRFLGQL